MDFARVTDRIRLIWRQGAELSVTGVCVWIMHSSSTMVILRGHLEHTHSVVRLTHTIWPETLNGHLVRKPLNWTEKWRKLRKSRGKKREEIKEPCVLALNYWGCICVVNTHFQTVFQNALNPQNLIHVSQESVLITMMHCESKVKPRICSNFDF